MWQWTTLSWTSSGSSILISPRPRLPTGTDLSLIFLCFLATRITTKISLLLFLSFLLKAFGQKCSESITATPGLGMGPLFDLSLSLSLFSFFLIIFLSFLSCCLLLRCCERVASQASPSFLFSLFLNGHPSSLPLSTKGSPSSPSSGPGYCQSFALSCALHA